MNHETPTRKQIFYIYCLTETSKLSLVQGKRIKREMVEEKENETRPRIRRAN